MPNPNKIIYSINIKDIQNVAGEHLGRKVSKREVKIVEDKLGDYIDWHEAIILTLGDAIKPSK